MRNWGKPNSRRFGERVEAADEESRIRSVALALQAYREHGARELASKLARKGYDRDAAAQVITDLCESGLVSDRRFAEAFVRAHASRGHGPIRIRHELRELGVAPELIEVSLAPGQAAIDIATGALNGCPQEFDWVQLAAEVRSRKFGKDAPHNFAERAKQMRFLQYRGFSTDQIRGAFALLGNEAYEADELARLDPDD